MRGLLQWAPCALRERPNHVVKQPIVKRVNFSEKGDQFCYTSCYRRSHLHTYSPVASLNKPNLNMESRQNRIIGPRRRSHEHV